jgi:thiamine kinase-like enzyme
VDGRSADDLDAVLSELRPRLGAPTAAPIALDGGITNRNYRVGFKWHDCVLRLAGKDTGLLGINRRAEWAANTAAADLKIAPRVLAWGDGWIVTEYMAGTPAEAADVRSRPEAIAEGLRRFHDCGLKVPQRFWVPDVLKSYREVVRDRGEQLPAAYAGAEELVGRIAGRLPLNDPVPCHNDLLPANVLRVGPHDAVMLVDWEYAGMGHRMFDLGNLAVNAGLGESEEIRLLDAYFGRPPDSRELVSLRLMRIMSDAREAAWGAVQNVISEINFDFDGYARQHFERLAAAADDPRFEEWLGAAAA